MTIEEKLNFKKIKLNELISNHPMFDSFDINGNVRKKAYKFEIILNKNLINNKLLGIEISNYSTKQVIPQNEISIQKSFFRSEH